MDAIYTRVGVVTRVPAEAMEEQNVESLNVLNYPVGAEYTPHYDWGADGKVRTVVGPCWASIVSDVLSKLTFRFHHGL